MSISKRRKKGKRKYEIANTIVCAFQQQIFASKYDEYKLKATKRIEVIIGENDTSSIIMNVLHLFQNSKIVSAVCLSQY